jgi:fumarate hydratase class II
MVKRAAAQTNRDLGLLPRRRARAIAAAAQEVIDGKLDDQFPIDVYQTGSGTSTNTNANEVIANRATEILGGERGSKLVHPNDHVNMCQSSNDVIPTAIQLAAALAIDEELIPALERLGRALEAKSREFWPVVKTGRTHLQDATPVRLGQEFRGYAGQIEESVRRARAAIDELARLPLGGTAVGTGINSHPQYARMAVARLAKETRLPLRETPNHFHAQATLDAVVAAHGALRTIATSLWKIGSDIRLMGTGPIAGLGELRLPETQPGSSIMPGKVNPVIIESLLMVIARVYGNDATVVVAGQSGSLFELNVMMPVAAVATLESITLLAASARNFSERCVEGLQATERGPELVERSPMLATALNPIIGYDEAAKLAKESIRTGRSIRQLARAKGVSEKELNKVLDLGKMTKPGLEGPGGGG